MRYKLILIVAFAMFFVTSISAQKVKPNIILFITDDVSWKDLGCYGNPFTKTLNIDKYFYQIRKI
jgi:hypothetical protein